MKRKLCSSLNVDTEKKATENKTSQDDLKLRRKALQEVVKLGGVQENLSELKHC